MNENLNEVAVFIETQRRLRIAEYFLSHMPVDFCSFDSGRMWYKFQKRIKEKENKNEQRAGGSALRCVR